MVTVLLLLRRRAAFWEQLETESSLTPLLVNLMGFIILASALYGAALAGWRATRLSLYVGLKWWLLVYILVTLQMVTTLRPLLAKPASGWWVAGKKFFLVYFGEQF